MSQPRHPPTLAAARGELCSGAVWVDSGITLGLAGFGTAVYANRPAMHVAAARGLHKQFGAAH